MAIATFGRERAASLLDTSGVSGFMGLCNVRGGTPTMDAFNWTMDGGGIPLRRVPFRREGKWDGDAPCG